MFVGREHLKQKKDHWFDLLVEREQGKIKKARHKRKCPPFEGHFDYEVTMAHQFVFLTSQFYEDYRQCSEIEQKPDRPHLRMVLEINGTTFAIPFRSNISHPHALLTDEENKCGLDFSKAVVITDTARYIDSSRFPHIRQNEFDALRGKEHIIKVGMLRYIRAYEKALERPDVPRNAKLLEYSTLQYFPEFVQTKAKPEG